MEKYNTKGTQIYNYLVEKTVKGEEIPNLTGIVKDLNMISQTVSCALIRLDMDGKIRYEHGKVLWVKVPKANADREREIKTVKHQKTYTSEEIRTKYKNAVNELLKSIIDTTNDMPSDRKIDLMKSILNITDNLQNKLFEE
jgi:hypothetical protein